MKERLYFALFPRKCAACGEVIDYRHFYCEACEQKLPYIPEERCEYCGVEKKECACAKHKNHYESIIAPFYYEGGARHAALKLKRYSIYAQVLAAECVKVVRRYYASDCFDLVTAVPMRERRLRETGFNHSRALAQRIAEQIAVPYADTLCVLYEGQAQHRLNFSLRTGNVRGIYDIIDGTDLKDKRILLVDDIKTSGATLNECALMLKLHGACSVKAVSAVVGRR